MNSRRQAAVVAVTVVAVVVLASVLQAGPQRDGQVAPREVTLTGKIVDLQSYMTEKFSSADQAKSVRECLHHGVPAALETEEGLVVIGQGWKGPARTIADLALQNAEVKGKLYERHGLRYIDITSAKLIPQQADEPANTGDWTDEPADEFEPDDDTQGADDADTRGFEDPE